MTLAEELRKVVERALAAADASHDYCIYSKRIWHLLQQIVNEGRTFTFYNRVTGTRMNEQVLPERTRLYVAGYLLPSTFQHLVSTFEDFVFDALRLWLISHPGSLTRKQLEFGTVLKAPDKETVVRAVVEKELNELKYERIADWFVYFDKLVKLGCPSQTEIAQLAEIKATRDILVHNKGIVNATYIFKAGAQARRQQGEHLEITEPYLQESWQTIKKAIRDVGDAVISKA